MRIQVIGEKDAQLEAVRHLFREYNEFLGFDLCFQNFEAELTDLPGKYAAPTGRLYLTTVDNEPAACTGFYRLTPEICELKRLYVRPRYARKGIGSSLLETALRDAKNAGYQTMRLDSLRRLQKAGILYRKFNFREIPPYNENPFDDVYYMERTL